MALSVYPLGPILVGGGTIFVCAGAAPSAGVRWTLAGPGTLTPIGNATSTNGTAIARYDALPGPSTTGYAIEVSVEVYS